MTSRRRRICSPFRHAEVATVFFTIYHFTSWHIRFFKSQLTMFSLLFAIREWRPSRSAPRLRNESVSGALEQSWSVRCSDPSSTQNEGFVPLVTEEKQVRRNGRISVFVLRRQLGIHKKSKLRRCARLFNLASQRPCR